MHPDTDPHILDTNPAIQFKAKYRSRSNTNPDPIRMQDFDDKKCIKFTGEIFYLNQKLQFAYP